MNKVSKLSENTNLKQDNSRKTELENNSEIKETEYEILKEKIISEEYDREEIIGYTIDGQPINRGTLRKDEKVYYLKQDNQIKNNNKQNLGPASQKQTVGKEKKSKDKNSVK